MPLYICVCVCGVCNKLNRLQYSIRIAFCTRGNQNICVTCVFVELPCGSDGKESACNAGDLGSIPGLGRSPGEENDYPLQHSGLENSMDRGAWWATGRGVTKSWTRLNSFHCLKFHSPQ